MPWLRLREPVRVGNVLFAPFQVERPSPLFAGHRAVIRKILAMHRETGGEPVAEAVVLLPDGWTPPIDAVQVHGDDIRAAADTLFLGALAANEYAEQGAQYINSRHCELLVQYYTMPPTHTTFHLRRKDGTDLSAAWRVSKIRTTVPPECAALQTGYAAIDGALIEALQALRATASPLAKRVELATEMMKCACTDSPAVPWQVEVVQCAAALEALCDAKQIDHGGIRRDLSLKIGELLRGYGTGTVADGLAARPSIRLDPGFEDAQRGWFPHRKWCQELYDLRNDLMHSTAVRVGGWTAGEHLLMAAFVFPLLVKLLLSRKRLYKLSLSDEARCRAIDQLLTCNEWGKTEGNGQSRWANVVHRVDYELRLREAIEAAKAGRVVSRPFDIPYQDRE